MLLDIYIHSTGQKFGIIFFFLRFEVVYATKSLFIYVIIITFFKYIKIVKYYYRLKYYL